MADQLEEDEPFVSTIGPVKVDWPRSIGFYGGLGLAVALDLVAPPLAAFIAVVPLLKALKRRNASAAERFFAAVFEGAAKPVGGDAESVVQPEWQADEKKKEDENARAKNGGTSLAGNGAR